MTNTVSETVSDETLNAIIQIESGGRLNIKAATSSALGLGQFLNATWLGVVKKHRPDLMDGRSQAEVLALRVDPQIAVELLARFTEDNQRAIGMDATGGDLYLAHFLGVADARDFFRADPHTLVTKLVTPQVIAANKSIMLNKDGSPKNAGQIRAWAAKRMFDSGGRNWVAKYYTPPAAPEPLLEEPALEPEPTAENIPDPQDAPATPLPRPDLVPPVTPAPGPIAPVPNEGFFDWIKRRGRMIAGWVSGGGIGIGGVSWFSDWRIAAVIVAGLIIAGTIVGIFYLINTRRR